MNEVTTFANANESSKLVSNPFGEQIGAPSTIGAAQAVSHELAEMQAQIYLAKQFPRDQRQAAENVLTACQRPGLASVAVYSYARGGVGVVGPSIRLAEEIARAWGNLECGWNELERDSDKSKIRAFAWDKETNVLKTLYFYVPHYRTTKQGRKRITEERDLYELLANQAARRMRNCILALIPGDVIDAAVEQCQKTMATHVDISPESRKKLVEAFAQFGVTKEQIEKRIQRKLETISPAQFVKMREIFTSLNDGMSDPDDWFEMEKESASAPGQNPAANATAASDSLKAALKASKTPLPGADAVPCKNTHEDQNDAQNAQEPPKQASRKNAAKKAPAIQTVDELRATIATTEKIDDLHKILSAIMAREDLADDVKEQLYHMIDDISVKNERERA